MTDPGQPPPPHPRGALAQAVADHRAGRLEAAEGHCRAVLAAVPDHPDARNLLAMILVQTDRAGAGADLFQALADERPDEPAFVANLGGALMRLNRPRQAAEAFQKALALDPDSAPALGNLGLARQALGDLPGAVAAFRAAVDRAPDDAALLSNLGALLKESGDLAGAEACLDRALARDPANPQAHFNRGRLMEARERPDAALESYRRAIRLRPDFADARANVSTLLLSQGRLEEGWREFEWRAALRSLGGFTDRVWTGQEVAGRTVLVWGEQGIGDQILFATCLPDLIARAGHVIVACDDRLAPLFQRAFPTASVRGVGLYRGADAAASADFDWLRDLPPVDLFAPLGSLPRFLRPTLDSFTDPGAILVPDPEKARAWRRWLEGLGPGPKVGLAWRSLHMTDDRAGAYPPLGTWAPLLKLPGLVPVSAQVAMTRAEVDQVSALAGRPLIRPPDLDLTDDLDGTLALVSELDAVVAADTYLPMLSAAAGVPTWRVNRGRKASDWSFLGADAYPWFATLRARFATTRKDLTAAFAAVAGELSAGEMSRVAPRAAAGGDDQHRALLTDALGHHNAGRRDRARALYERLLAARPDHAEALHYLGVLCLQDGDAARAADLIGKSVAADGGDARRQVNLGLALKAAGRPGAARRALGRAIAAQPDLPEAHNNLGAVLMDQGRPAEAAASFAEAIRLRPGYADAHGNLGQARAALGDPQAAVDSFQRARALGDGSARLLNDLGAAWLALDRPDQAIPLFRDALAADPRNVPAANNLGNALAGQGDFAGAEAAYAQALAADPGFHTGRANLAAARERAGRLDDARDAAKAVPPGHPAHLLAQVVLAKCDRRDGHAAQALARLEGLPVARAPVRDQGHYWPEVGLLRDRLNLPAEALAAFTLANRLAAARPEARRVDRAAYPREIATLKVAFSADARAAWTAAPDLDDGPAPLFLVGFPRSGTTLAGRMLAAHPALRVVEERPLLAPVHEALKARGVAYPRDLAGLDGDTLRRLRGLYRAAAATVLGGDLAPGRKIVDKMPLNLVDAGLIHRLFPEARFLFVLRHPADACLSCFMQDFRANRALVHFDTLEGTVALYDRVMDLWRHFRQVLDLDVQTLRYEDLVAHPEATARLLLEDLDLPWTDAVLDHTAKAGAPVRAPSYHQVAEPLYARAVDRWRRYAPHLGDALDPLVPHARAFGYDMDLSE